MVAMSIGCIAKCIARGANMTLSTRRPLPGETHHRETGRGLSVQMHHHRAEHWVVVAGTAKVTIDGDIKLLGENESIYIPLGATHCLENPGKIPLDLIEVRSGSYLEEDDVVRFADRYGRV